jgi:chlorobactene glucosyltransferase
MVSLALDATAALLAAASALCAWRSCRWLARVEAAARARDATAAARVAAPPAADPPLVSLLVPARDEERNVVACLAGLLEQTHPRCEVIVLDDGSSDATARVAKSAIAGFAGRCVALAVGAADAGREPEAPAPAARVVVGRPLEPGWGGKSFACHQLAELACGDWLFFLDADTRLEPHAVERALASAFVVDAELVSFLPRYAGRHWVNRLVVPWLYFFLTALVPLPEVRRLRHERLAVANGQAILVRREAYDRMGGHAAVRDHIVEDVSLAIAAKRAGLAIALLDGHRWLACEMYDGVRALGAGFAKSFHSAARRYPLHWAALLALLVLIGVRPWLRLWTAGAALERWLALLAIVLVGATFAGLLRRFAQDPRACLVWPLALGSLLALAIAGGVSGLLGRELSWRGRAVGGRAPS